MISLKEAIYGVIFMVISMFIFLFVKDLMCNSYGMDYSIILGQCIESDVK